MTRWNRFSHATLVASLALILSSVHGLVADAQDLTVDVVRDPSANTATYTLDIRSPPGGPRIDRFFIPGLGPNFVLPPSVIVPPNWNGAVVPGPGSGWNYDPFSDPKFGFYSPTIPPSLWINPPFVLRFDTNTNPVLPGNNQGGFSFKSPKKPIQGPALFGPQGDPNVFPIDPLVPGLVSFVPEPSTLALGALGLLLLATLYRRRP